MQPARRFLRPSAVRFLLGSHTPHKQSDDVSTRDLLRLDSDCWKEVIGNLHRGEMLRVRFPPTEIFDGF